MIRSFATDDTRRVFHRQPVRSLPPDVQLRALRKLRLLDTASTLNDLMAAPGIRLEKLTGHRAGQYSIRINEQWRICFRWVDGDAFDVEIVDYH